ncbi:MAG: Hpt domain-containing protein, partial [Terracidiphilus sp.]
MDDLELFKQSFREEAREVLVDLEAALLELNEKREDCEVVGRVFRGLHTLKGSGAMFGFEELAAFTHDLESAFDAVRNGRLEVSGELVDLTLASLDQIKSMLDQSVVVDAAAISRRSRLLTEIRHLAGLAQTAAPGLKSALEPIPKSGENEPRQEWRVTFAPGPDLLMNGTN